jgi:signal recognition particle receptor subunit beta
VVDTNDTDRLAEAKKELHDLMEDQNLKNVPLLVVLNKMDLEQKYDKSEFSGLLRLGDLTDNPWAVVTISALNGTNLADVISWLVAQTPK